MMDGAHGGGQAEELKSTLGGQVLLPADAGYDAARLVWNAAVQRRPAAVVRCRGREDVAHAVRFASACNLPVSVKGGGHDWAGRAVSEGGVMLDLSAMDAIALDPAQPVARFGGGTRSRQLVAAAARHGLVPVTGNCGDVGVVGLTLGGGYSTLSAQYGLAADNLVGAEVVLASGRTVVATAEENEDLFWALRGGNGGFGVVTAMWSRLHRPAPLVGGVLGFPMAEVRSVLAWYAELQKVLPDELGMSLGMMSGPDGRPAVVLTPLWNGDEEQGAGILGTLNDLGTVAMSTVQPTTFEDFVASFDVFGQRANFALATCWLPELSEGAVAAMVDAMARRTSPHSAVFMHHFDGAAARVPVEATAFGMRQPHFLIEIIACWGEEEPDETAHRRWADDLLQALEPFAFSGGYANLLEPGDRRLRDAFGPHAARLRELKAKYDPDHVFGASHARFG